jgi:hypothetical protein
MSRREAKAANPSPTLTVIVMEFEPAASNRELMRVGAIPLPVGIVGTAHFLCFVEDSSTAAIEANSIGHVWVSSRSSGYPGFWWFSRGAANGSDYFI